MFVYKVLREFARHWKTGQPIPEEKAAKLGKSQKLLAASVSYGRFKFGGLHEKKCCFSTWFNYSIKDEYI